VHVPAPDDEPDRTPPDRTQFAPLEVALPDGRRLRVRRLTGDDVAAVHALYEGLDLEDRRLRFLSTFHPPRSFVARWLAPERGLVLGAFVSTPSDGPDGTDAPNGPGPAGERLVAEAGYALLPNGNGELGITTAGDWRGWLGPFLLDVLAAAAHRAGVPNLEADVRLDNRPMLGLIRHRGAAVVTQPAWGEVRLVMGTAGHAPGWSPRRAPGRVRVLVESPAGRWTPAAGDRAAPPDDATVEVIGCAGPHGRPGGRCPLLDGGHCPLVEGADAVVVVTPADGDPSFEALAARHEGDADGPPTQRCGTAAAVAETIRRLVAQRPR